MTLSWSTVKIRCVAKGESPALGSALIFPQADMLLIFSCGDTKSLKTWVHKQLFFNLTANRQLKRMNRGTKYAVCAIHTFLIPILNLSADSLELNLVCACAFSLGIICQMTAFQPLSSSLAPSVARQWMAAAPNSRAHNHHTSLRHSRGPHARAQEQPSGKVTNNVAPSEKDKLGESYPHSASFQGWSQVTANLVCVCQQEHICSSAKLYSHHACHLLDFKSGAEIQARTWAIVWYFPSAGKSLKCRNPVTKWT